MTHMAGRLWEEIQSGDKTSFDVLFNNTVVSLTNQAYRLLKNEAQTKDVIQEVFIRIYLKRNELPADLNVEGYLYTAVKRQCINILRDQMIRHKHHQIILESARDTDTITLPYESEEQLLLRKKVDSAISKLPEKCRKVFQLNHYEQLSYKSIAERLGISVKTVEKHMSRAFQVLREQLSEDQYILMIAGIIVFRYDISCFF